MSLTLGEMQTRLVRYADLIACKTAFIDARTPGSDKKENFCIIGPGVTENPGQHVHVKISHGFNIGGARQPKGCLNSQHSHDTEEVFLVHSGVWAFRWGHDAKDGEVILRAGDIISLPVRVFRGFECVSDEESFLFAILGQDDPGHVTWAPYVFEQAKHHGLVLTKAGRLIDTMIGDSIPEGDEPCRPTSIEDLGSFRRMTVAEMSRHVVRTNELTQSAQTELTAHSEGVTEIAIIGPENPTERISEAMIPSRHGFHFRKVAMRPTAYIPPHSRSEEEVVFVHEGTVKLSWDKSSVELARGDTLTIPKGLTRSWSTTAAQGASLFVVRGGDMPAAPIWSH